MVSLRIPAGAPHGADGLRISAIEVLAALAIARIITATWLLYYGTRLMAIWAAFPLLCKITIRRPSRRFFLDGRSPLLLAARVTSRWYGLPAAKVCYLPPVNGLRSSPWSVVLPPGPLPIDALSTHLSFVHSSPLYPHNILCTKTPGCGIYTLTPETFHRASGCFSL